MSVVMKNAMDDLHKSAIGLMDVGFRFFLCLLLMKFVFLDWLRYLASPAENVGRDQEIVRPFDGFTGGPAPVAENASELPLTTRLYGPSQLSPAPPPIPTDQPVWPTVRMPDGSKVQLGPNGEMRPVQ